jgi:KDO2-lipid IV(A) lauroyltransferase
MAVKRTGIIPWLQYMLVRTAFALMQAFSIKRNLRTARIAARIWPWLMPRHLERAKTHLSASLGGEYAPERLAKMAERSLESVAMFAVEAVCLPRLINRFTWGKYIELKNLEGAVQRIVDGRGVILVSGHYGSFEVMGHLLAGLGYDAAAVMRPLDNVYLNRFIVRSRKMHGLALLDKKGATSQAEELLRRGALLGFIADQDAGRKGVFVDFFGRPASTYKSIGLLAMATGSPIVVGYARRLGSVARYEVGVQRIIDAKEWEAQEQPLEWITQAYTAAIEEFVRRDPDQYLWIHRRWKSVPRRAAKGSKDAGSSAARQSDPLSV